MCFAWRLMFLAGLALLTAACNHYDPYNPDTSHRIGVWGIDNSDSRRPEEVPVMRLLHVYATHMEYSAGNGTVGTEGQWHDDGFWVQKPDGSGEVEVAKIVGPEELEVHVSAFQPQSQEVEVLYKMLGNEAEMQAMADRYPGPITYPPPAGAITFGMTEFELRNLPWKPDQTEPTGDDSFSRGTLLTYHSDDPRLSQLKVTVKLHHVVLVEGGN